MGEADSVCPGAADVGADGTEEDVEGVDGPSGAAAHPLNTSAKMAANETICLDMGLPEG